MNRSNNSCFTNSVDSHLATSDQGRRATQATLLPLNKPRPLEQPRQDERFQSGIRLGGNSAGPIVLAPANLCNGRAALAGAELSELGTIQSL
jgi:hypothetical protein